MLTERSQIPKASNYMIPLTRSVQNRQIHRDRTQIIGFQVVFFSGGRNGVTDNYTEFLFAEMTVVDFELVVKFAQLGENTRNH